METALLVALGLVVGLAIAGLAVFIARPRTPAEDPAAAQRAAEQTAAAQMADQRIVELGARVQQMGELLAKAQTQLQSSMHERLDAVTAHLGTSMQNATKHTTDNLQKLNERLAVIDSAQKNLTDLASQVTSLRAVLSNKQTRGAFGQGRMEAIIQDQLPKGTYEFQYTLKNGRRPDCVVMIPDQRPLVIDAKFPLEAVTAFRDGKTDDERKTAAQRVRADVTKHINDIAEKYLCPGETQDTALMFVPSESVYAELHDGFDDIVQKGYRAQVMMVSPALLMLAIQVIRQVQKDTQMREAADLIRAEVGQMLKDVRLLGDRVKKLQTHFGQANEDLGTILTSANKIEKRGARIEEMDFEGNGAPPANVIPAPVRRIKAAGEF
ncbi:DNA recombination protein RmuC [Rhodoplanes sp. Z2-YC6860]|uniref:DNA recombination protein RmuC n=1 Tax=Rhodoplanes sp. Z2-YC6860 TaxID=674703 RepID=UPI00078E1321|nr:DNA recombination protein RmuC [Rhodoplanes sp. Z2-YC6860]AMN45083.1 DNA recombination protein RmuC [Rhodoplanes sp. Z2-YC6860]